MDDIEDLFAQARAGAMRPSDGLTQRVLADADRLQQRPAAVMARAPVAQTEVAGFWSWLSGVFGGGLSLAGIGSAAVMGLFVGLTQPTALMSMTAGLTGSDTLYSLELIPGVDALLAEE